MVLRVACLTMALAACRTPVASPAAPPAAWVPMVCRPVPAVSAPVDPRSARLIVQAVGPELDPIASFDVDLIDNGTSIVRSVIADCRPGIVELYGLTPGLPLEIVITAPGYLPQRRHTALSPADNSALFWLGRPGMQFYLQGDTPIPYSRAKARYLVLLPSGASSPPSVRHQALLAAAAGARDVSLDIVEGVSGHPSWYDRIVEAEVSVRGSSADRRRAIGELARHLRDHPEQGRLVLALGERGRCFTGELEVTFAKVLDQAELDAFADRYDLVVVRTHGAQTTMAMKAPDAAFPDLIEVIKRERVVASIDATFFAPLQIDAS